MSAIAAISLGYLRHTSLSLSSSGSLCRPPAGRASSSFYATPVPYLAIGESEYHSNELFLEFLCQEVAELLRTPIRRSSVDGFIMHSPERIFSGAKQLMEELLGYRININLQTGHDSYQPWREGGHDDL